MTVVHSTVVYDPTAQAPAYPSGEFLPTLVSQWSPIEMPRKVRAAVGIAAVILSLEPGRPADIAPGEFLPTLVTQWQGLTDLQRANRSPSLAQQLELIYADRPRLRRLDVSPDNDANRALPQRRQVDMEATWPPAVPAPTTPTPTTWLPHPQERDPVRGPIGKGMLLDTAFLPLIVTTVSTITYVDQARQLELRRQPIRALDNIPEARAGVVVQSPPFVGNTDANERRPQRVAIAHLPAVGPTATTTPVFMVPPPEIPGRVLRRLLIQEEIRPLKVPTAVVPAPTWAPMPTLETPRYRRKVLAEGYVTAIQNVGGTATVSTERSGIRDNDLLFSPGQSNVRRTILTRITEVFGR
jgi:hypothetical protein